MKLSNLKEKIYSDFTRMVGLLTTHHLQREIDYCGQKPLISQLGKNEKRRRNYRRVSSRILNGKGFKQAIAREICCLQ